jgi:hypothetical protein
MEDNAKYHADDYLYETDDLRRVEKVMETE